MRESGYAVYHGPIKEVAESYLPGRIVDLTGLEMEDVLQAVKRGTPVWVITNESFAPLSPDQMESWETDEGPVTISWSEHSVLITGFDAEYIYVNDPLDSANRKLDREAFTSAWQQMGGKRLRI